MKTRPDPSTKPYYKCLHCQDFRKECGGISTRGMTLLEKCEMLRDVKDFCHLKIPYIAQEARASEKTVERLMALNCEQDILSETLERIQVVVFGHAGNRTCCGHCTNKVDEDTIQRMAKLEEELAYWRKENDRKAKIIDKLLD